jgi:hypothetical protein
MVHHRERLTFLLESCDDRLRVHARLDELQRYSLNKGLPTLRKPNLTKAAFADLRDQLVDTDRFPRRMVVAAIRTNSRWAARAAIVMRRSMERRGWFVRIFVLYRHQGIMT